MSKWWDNVTPWNTQDERNQNAENKRKQAALEAELELKKKSAGLLDDNSLKALELSANSKMYLILGGSLVLIVIAIFHFKSKRR